MPHESDLWTAAINWVIKTYALARVATTQSDMPDGIAVEAEKCALRLEAVCWLWDKVFKGVNWQELSFSDGSPCIPIIAELKKQNCATRREALEVLGKLCEERLRQLTYALTAAKEELRRKLPMIEWPSSVKEVLYNGS